MKLLAILFFFSISIFAKDFKTLHVSTWPANTEIYAEKLTPDYSTKADYTTPATIKIPLHQNKISLTFFHFLLSDNSFFYPLTFVICKLYSRKEKTITKRTGNIRLFY